MGGRVGVRLRCASLDPSLTLGQAKRKGERVKKQILTNYQKRSWCKVSRAVVGLVIGNQAANPLAAEFITAFRALGEGGAL